MQKRQGVTEITPNYVGRHRHRVSQWGAFHFQLKTRRVLPTIVAKERDVRKNTRGAFQCRTVCGINRCIENVRILNENTGSWRGFGPGQIKVDTGSFLKNISEFDHVEFGVTAKDAKAMALSTRKLLELSFLSLLDSGINYRGQDVGCYMSAVDFDILSIANQVR